MIAKSTSNTRIPSRPSTRTSDPTSRNVNAGSGNLRRDIWTGALAKIKSFSPVMTDRFTATSNAPNTFSSEIRALGTRFTESWILKIADLPMSSSEVATILYRRRFAVLRRLSLFPGRPSRTDRENHPHWTQQLWNSIDLCHLLGQAKATVHRRLHPLPR
jgi:hypothetical protein